MRVCTSDPIALDALRITPPGTNVVHARVPPSPPPCVQQDRRDSVEESTTDQEQLGWWGGGGDGRRGNNHRRSRSADMTSAETAAAAGEAAIQEDDDDDDDGGGDDSLGRSASSLSLPESARPGWEQGRRSWRRSSSRLDSSGLNGGFAGSDKERGENAAGALEDDDDHSRGGRENHHHTFPDLFGACRPSHHERHRRRERSLSSPPSSPSATLEPTRPSSVGRNRNRGRDRQPAPPPRRRLSLEVPRTAADRWVDEGTDSVPFFAVSFFSWYCFLQWPWSTHGKEGRNG